MTQKKNQNKIKYKAGPRLPEQPESNLLTPERVNSLLDAGEAPLSDAELLAKELLLDAEKKGLSPADIVKRNEDIKNKISAERKKRKSALSGRNIVISVEEANELFKRLSSEEGEKKEEKELFTPANEETQNEPQTAKEKPKPNTKFPIKKPPKKPVGKKAAETQPKADDLGDTKEISLPKRFKAPKKDTLPKRRVMPVYEPVDLASELVAEPPEALAEDKVLQKNKAKEQKPNVAEKKKSAENATKKTPKKASDKTVSVSDVLKSEADVPASEKPTPIKKRSAIKVVFCSVCVFLLLFPLALFSLSDACFYALYDGDELSAVSFSFVPITDENAGELFHARTEDRFTVTDYFTPLFPLKKAEAERAFPVDIKTDGAVATVYVTSGMTVAEAIERSAFTYNEYDIITPEATATLTEAGEITIKRVTLSYRTVFEEMKSEKVVKPSPLIPDGQTMLMNEGQGFGGSAYYDYVDRFVDGVYFDTETVGVTVEDLPYNEITLLGDSTATASPIDGTKYTDVTIIDNVPSSYKGLSQSAPCTAYSFKPGVYGSSGMRLVQGMVAVDPDEYNYGDLLYITSADGSFVYGWAIAADACEAAMWGTVEIDCFFETYKESVLFGKRYLNVYVVDTLTKEQLEEYKEHEGMFNLRVPD